MERVDGIVSPSTTRLAASISALTAQLARVCFAALVVLIPFRMRMVLLARPIDPIYRDYTDVLLFATDGFLLALLALWMVGFLLEPRRLKTGPRFLSLPLAGVTALGAVSIFASVDPLVSAYHVVRMVLLAGLYLYVLNEVTLDRLVLPVALQVAIQSVIGIAQVLQQHSLGLSGLQEVELDPAWSGVSIVWAEGVRSLRAYGLTDHPNILGGCLAFGLLLLGGWYAGSKTRWHTLVGALFALGALGLLVTFSRAAWVALAGGLALCLIALLRAQRWEAVARWFGLGGAALILLLPFLWNDSVYLGVRLDANDAFSQVALENRSLTERGNLVQSTLQIWREHPLFGIGVGALPEAERARYPDPDEFGANYQPAHFVLLDVVAETGILGGIVYFALVVAPWLALWRNRRRLTFSPALTGVSAVLLAVTLVGLFDYYTWQLAPGQLWQWLAWGLWGSVYSSSLGARHA